MHCPSLLAYLLSLHHTKTWLSPYHYKAKNDTKWCYIYLRKNKLLFGRNTIKTRFSCILDVQSLLALDCFKIKTQQTANLEVWHRSSSLRYCRFRVNLELNKERQHKHMIHQLTSAFGKYLRTWRYYKFVKEKTLVLVFAFWE